jgi:hypothetical protein
LGSAIFYERNGHTLSVKARKLTPAPDLYLRIQLRLKPVTPEEDCLPEKRWEKKKTPRQEKTSRQKLMESASLLLIRFSLVLILDFTPFF